MKKMRYSKRTLLRYILFQIPDLAVLVLLLIFLRRWLELPAWFNYGLIVFWIIKDIFMFPFAWRAYDTNRTHPMVGARGIAEERLAPSGYIRVNDELWKAEVLKVQQEIEKGEAVLIREIKGLTLVVEPTEEVRKK